MSEAVGKPPRMTVEAFLAWAEGQPGRYELHDGKVVTMQSERIAHVLVKGGVLLAFRSAVRAAGVPCIVLGDGATVRIDERTAFEPDGTVHCGPFDPNDRVARHPVVVVEVLSPSSHFTDFIRKLADYFRLASVAHYLIIDPDKRVVLHYQRAAGEISVRVLGETVESARLALDPPGITVAVADFFADLPPAGDGAPAS